MLSGTGGGGGVEGRRGLRVVVAVVVAVKVGAVGVVGVVVGVVLGVELVGFHSRREPAADLKLFSFAAAAPPRVRKGDWRNRLFVRDGRPGATGKGGGGEAQESDLSGGSGLLVPDGASRAGGGEAVGKRCLEGATAEKTAAPPCQLSR